jgi:hypothetical protein
MDPCFATLVLGIAGLAVALAYDYFEYLAKKKTEKKRTEEFKQVARDLGLEFVAEGDAAFFQSLNRFHLFSQGDSKKIWNLLRGKSNNVEVAIFDYSYNTHRGKHSHTWKHSVVCFRFEGPELPNFSLRPKNVWHKIGFWFGYPHIDFDSHPVFSSNYLLRGDDENAIRMLFADPILEFYEQNPGLSTEGSGNMLLFYRHSVRIGPQRIRAFMEEGLKALSLYHSAA